MRLIQINTSVNSGSTGRIAEDIGRIFLSKGHESFIAYGRRIRPSKSHLIRVGGKLNVIGHGVKTVLFDRHGFASVAATKLLISEIDRIQPDAVGLHNLHGYYLNIEILFKHLKKLKIPVVWTLFDCWAFTGHCTYFDDIECDKWITGCSQCPKTRKYPSSYLLDNSKRNYKDKRSLFTGIENLSLIVHSQWLKKLVDQSFLSSYPIHHIFSGIDLDVFRPIQDNAIKKRYNIDGKIIILGVASKWSERKGLKDFVKLNEYLLQDQVLVLVGLSGRQIERLPAGIVGIARTESILDLAALYSAADVFVNPTYQDNFPTTNIEALACGTPVVTYNTGGSPESIDQNTGIVVNKGDISGLVSAVNEIINSGRKHFTRVCRKKAENYYNKDERFLDYLNLYTAMLDGR